MRVFVAGATGAIGRPLVAALVAAGHEVTGMTRSAERAETIRAEGAEAAVCDALDGDALERAVVQARPDVVVHQLTALPDRFDFRDKTLYDETNRVRTEGTANLVGAARAAGAGRIVAQSIAFVYRGEGGWVKDEEAPVIENAPGSFGGALRAAYDLERQVLGAEGLDGLVLRYAFFYGAGTAYASDGYYAAEAARRRLPVIGSGDGHVSFIHVSDAAAATVAACERGAPGVYNVADDEPAAMRDWVPAFCEAVGAKRPFKVPAFIARLVAGAPAVTLATQSRSAANGKAKSELGWEPRIPSWRQGFRVALD